MHIPRQLTLFSLLPQTIDRVAGIGDDGTRQNAKIIVKQLDEFSHTYEWFIIQERTFILAKNNFSNAMEFVNCVLTQEQDKAFTSWYESKDRKANAAIDESFADGYRVSVSWDDFNQTFIASLTYKGDKGDNKGKCLTARSDDWLESIAMVVYKHHVIFNQGAWSNVSGTSVRG